MDERNTNEREQSKDTILLVFEEKIDNLIEAVRDIKDSITHTSEQVSSMKIDVVTLQNKTEQQQKEIAEEPKMSFFFCQYFDDQKCLF